MTPLNYRFVIIFLFASANTIAASIASSHSAIASLISLCFSDNSPTYTYLISMIGIMGELFVIFPSNFLLEKLKMRKMVILCSLFIVIGEAMKNLVNHSVWFVIIGHFITVGVFVFYTNGSTKLSAIWFKAEERTVATSVTLGANFVGFSLGFLINAIVFDNSIDITNVDISKTKEKIVSNFKMTLMVSVIVLIVMIIFFKEQPNEFICESNNVERSLFLASFSSLYHDPVYIKICINYALADSNFQLMVFLLQIIFARFGIDNTTIFISGFIMNISCAVSFMLYGFVISKFISLKKGVELGTLSNVISISLLFLCIFTKDRILIIFGSLVYGFTFNIYCTPSCELATEQSFPVSEEQAVGVLMFVSILFGIIFSFVIEKIIEAGLHEMVIIGVIFGIYVFSYFVIKSAEVELKRSNYDNLIKNPIESFHGKNNFEMNLIAYT